MYPVSFKFKGFNKKEGPVGTPTCGKDSVKDTPFHEGHREGACNLPT